MGMLKSHKLSGENSYIVQVIYGEVVTGRYKIVVDLSDSLEVREEVVEVGSEVRAGK